MTKQAIIGAIITITWMLLGAFEIISSFEMFIGVVGLMIGTGLTLWEKGEEK